MRSASVLPRTCGANSVSLAQSNAVQRSSIALDIDILFSQLCSAPSAEGRRFQRRIGFAAVADQFFQRSSSLSAQPIPPRVKKQVVLLFSNRLRIRCFAYHCALFNAGSSDPTASNVANQQQAHPSSNSSPRPDTTPVLRRLYPPHRFPKPRTPEISRTSVIEGCDERIREEALHYAFQRAFHQIPWLIRSCCRYSTIRRCCLSMTTVNDSAQGYVFAGGVTVCVYSDREISVYVPTSVFTERMMAFRLGISKPHEKFLGLTMPESRFDALTYWRFKGPIAPEFSLFIPSVVERRELVRYEAVRYSSIRNRKSLYSHRMC